MGLIPDKGPFGSLSFRINFFNMLGVLIIFLAVFQVLDHLQRAYLLNRIDQSLETEVLVFTSEMDSLKIEITSADLTPELRRFSRAHGIANSFLRILTEEGAEIAASDLNHWPRARTHPVPVRPILDNTFYWETAPMNDFGARLIYYHYPEGPILQIGFDLEEPETFRIHSRIIFGGGMLMVLMSGSAFGWFSTRKALKAIFRVSDAAKIIREQGKLDFRVPMPTGSRETDQLASTFNDMLEKIKNLIQNLHTVMDNIAHDIKTPITRMRGVAETELRNLKSIESDQELAGHVVEECDHILNLVNTLLEITATESGLVRWRIARVDLVDLVREGCDLFAPVLENKNLSLRLQLPATCFLHTDGRAIQRVVSNLLDNAVKYTRPGGSIYLELRSLGATVELRITDSGIGIRAEEIPLIFDRFHRGDRGRSEPGNGLGLSFCKATLEALGGGIRCESRPGRGSTFTLSLPGEGEPEVKVMD